MTRFPQQNVTVERMPNPLGTPTLIRVTAPNGVRAVEFGVGAGNSLVVNLDGRAFVLDPYAFREVLEHLAIAVHV